MLSILAVLPILFKTPLYPESLLLSIDWKVPILSQIDRDWFETSPLTCRQSSYEASFPALLLPPAAKDSSAGSYSACLGMGWVCGVQEQCTAKSVFCQLAGEMNMLLLYQSTLGCRLWNFTEVFPLVVYSLLQFLRKANGCFSYGVCVGSVGLSLPTSFLLLLNPSPFLFSLPRESIVWELMKVLFRGLNFCPALGVLHAVSQGFEY